eukprot:TRINITY_DN3016_c0_g1_i2.p1 TRINITY_DN3016_c0_g1~~TRINITY_DN3016_c0_g1_i2.p1  ORF type:complete len:259 (+),score=96.31 TRINITY_DN3016_c0_g1_i2:734-1510(+)
MTDLQSIAAIGDHKLKTDKYKALLDDFIKGNKTKDLESFVDHMLDEKTPLVVSRTMLQSFATSIANLPVESRKEIAVYALEKTQPRVVAFEEQVSIIRLDLAQVYEDQEDWIEAAKVLIAIPLESGNRVLEPDYKVNIYIKIAQLYLEEEESVDAEKYVNRASEMIHQVKSDELKLRYKVCFARIMDYKRQFMKAALRYYELSQIVGEPGQWDALQCSVICAILASAGPQRSRILATLYKDERTSKLEVHLILEKMFF